MKSKFSLLMVITFAVCCTGCGSGAPKTVAVTGTVKFDGKPLPDGTITFMSMGEKGEFGRPATGVLNKEGKYKLSTFAPGDGALPGKYQVVVVSNSGVPSPEDIAEKGPQLLPQSQRAITARRHQDCAPQLKRGNRLRSTSN